MTCLKSFSNANWTAQKSAAASTCRGSQRMCSFAQAFKICPFSSRATIASVVNSLEIAASTLSFITLLGGWCYNSIRRVVPMCVLSQIPPLFLKESHQALLYSHFKVFNDTLNFYLHTTMNNLISKVPDCLQSKCHNEECTVRLRKILVNGHAEVRWRL